MKVLQLSSAQSWRGGEQQLIYLQEELPKLGINSSIFCKKNSDLHAYCQNKNLPHTTFSGEKFTAIFQLANTCRKAKPQLLHAHDSHSHTTAWLALSLKLIDIPLVVSRRVDFPIGTNILSQKKYNHSAVKKIICVSKAIQKIIEPQIKEKTKLTVVHDGIDPQRFAKRQPYPLSEKEKKQGTIRKELNISEEQILIGNVAALAPHKDYPTFIKTAHLLLDRGIPAHFLLFGEDGGCQKEIEQRIARSPYRKRFHLMGFRKDISLLLPELDLFLFTSKTEGLGSTLLDAMYCGVPIASTSAGGIPEIVQHEKNGLLAPPRNARKLALQAERILLDKKLSKRLVEQGKQQVSLFSKTAMSQKTAEIYGQIAAK